jgi:hypothetical protein
LWEKNLVTGYVSELVPCLVDMKPSSAYPRCRSWYSNISKGDVSIFDCNGCDNTITYHAPLFVDRRREMYRSVRRIAQADFGNLYHRMTHVGSDNTRETVQPDDMFSGEDHVRKPFRLFRVN